MRPSDEVDALRSAPVLLFFFSSFLSSFFFLRTGHRRVGGRCQYDERILFWDRRRRRGGSKVSKEMRGKDDLDLKKKGEKRWKV